MPWSRRRRRPYLKRVRTSSSVAISAASLNIAGKLRRDGSRIACRHVAEVLAGELSDPPIAISRQPMTPAARDFKANARTALADPQPEARARRIAGRARCAAHGRKAASAGVRGADGGCPRSSRPDARSSRPLSRGVQRTRPRLRARTFTGRKPPPKHATSFSACAAPKEPGSSPRASRWSRKRSASTRTSRRPASKWSRPISANISCKSAARRRAISSRLPSISAAIEVEADFRRRHTHLAADRRLDEPAAARRRGARRPEREVSRSRRRHHGRELPHRRDGLGDHRHQRGERRPDVSLAQGSHRGRLH